MNVFRVLTCIGLLALISCADDDLNSSPFILQGTIVWQHNFGGSQEDVAKGIIETSDGGYAIIGYTASIDGDITDKTSEENDFWVIRLDAQGEVIWQKTYGGSGDDQGRAIIQTNDGGFALTGPSKSKDGDGSENQGQHDHWIVKLDAMGAIEWQKSHGFAGHDHSHSLFQTQDGGYFMGGYLDVDASAGQGNETIVQKHGVGEFWAQKLDATGNLEWRRYFGGTNNDRIYKVLPAHDGNYLLVGSTESTDFDISNSKGSYDIWIVKIDPTGNLLWEKSFGGSGIDDGYSAIATPDGNYVIAGTSISGDGQVSSPIGNADIWVIKIDEDGKLIWEKSFGGTGFDSAQAIYQSSIDQSSMIIAGNSKSLDGDLIENKGENDFFVLKIDQQGKLIWSKSLGGSGLDLAYGVIETQDRSIVVVGETESNDKDITQNNGKKDFWVAKIN